MANVAPGSMTELAKKGDHRSLEDRWLTAMEEPDKRDEMLGTLEFLTKSGKGEQAAALGWSWMAAQKERAKPAEVLELGRELMLRCGDSPEMRKEILALYEEVYADRAELPKLIEASGLSGDKSPRRALRTLEICLNLKEGSFLLSRSEERAAEVVGIDLDMPEYTIRGKKGEDTLDPDTLALKYDLVPDNDFRALAQLHSERITDLLQSDPASLVVGLLHSHHGKLDSEELKHVLSPKYLPAGQWSSWWSKARAALNRSPNVVLEGRNPVLIVYYQTEQTLEDEILPTWTEADTPMKRLNVVETYLREAKARGATPSPQMVARLHGDLIKRVEAARKGSASEALLEAIAIDRLAAGDVLAPGQANPVCDIMRESPDVVQLLSQVEESRFYLRALDHVRELFADRWQELYVALMPHAPVDGCENIAKALLEADQADKLRELAESVLADFGKHLEAVCWLWRSKLATNILPIPYRELLLRLMEHLGQVTRDDYVAPKILRDTRTQIRTALSATNYSRFREVIEGMEPGLASTIRTTIDRLDSLGHVVRANLSKIIREIHPELAVSRKPVVDPWEDDSVIYCTQQGFEKRKEELDFLNRVKIPENARAIGEAAARGDLSENSEYKFALEERDLLQARAMKIQNELAIARTIAFGDVTTDQVGIGTKVLLTTGDGSDQLEFTILGPFESDLEQGIYNYRAPLCGRLRGLHIGDTARLELGSGERDYKVQAISNAVLK